jgi:hypothetical protein
MSAGYQQGGGSGGTTIDTSFQLISISGGIATLDAESKNFKNAYLDADDNFTIQIDNPLEGGQNLISITKTVSGDITVTLPAPATPETSILEGPTDSSFLITIVNTKISDGSGGTENVNVSTTIAL